MTTPLRVLLLEDHEADALLVLHELRAAGFEPEWKRVDDEAGYLKALDGLPDLICADYRLPQFDGDRALTLLIERGLDIPFIIVSGSIGEELAVAAMRKGAADYLLKDRLARLGQAVKQALEQKRLRDEKAQMEAALRRYLSMLAHELRNPLAPLLTSLEVARQPASDLRTRQQALDTMGRSIRQLARLVDDLLEATRVNQGGIPIRLTRVDLARLARLVAEDRHYVFDRAGVRLNVQTPQTPVWVMADEMRLAQCIHNLLDNAVRFSDRGGIASIEVRGEGPIAELTVRDTGIGIARADLGRIFRPFGQADRTLDRSRGGLGLGLSIVKTLIEAQQGTVEVASAGPGHGATFTIRLPHEPEPAALTDVPATPHEGKGVFKVLVVEDSRDAADSLKVLLELLGHQVDVSYTGPDGVTLATRWGPDVVLCDIGLPGLDGYGVATALRKHPTTAGARIVAVTGYGSEEDRRRAHEAGFDLLLRKPVEPADLERALQPASQAAG